VERDPREVRGLQLVGERPRPGEVAQVVDEDAGAVERVRGVGGDRPGARPADGE
jgi:hypothetical protein